MATTIQTKAMADLITYERYFCARQCSLNAEGILMPRIHVSAQQHALQNVPVQNDPISFVIGESSPASDMGPNSALADFQSKVMSLQRPWNWDYEGGRAIRRSACAAALDFVRRIRHKKDAVLPLPRVSPSRRGAVALTWRIGEESLTVFFSVRGAKTLYYQWEHADLTSEAGNETRENLIERLSAF